MNHDDIKSVIKQLAIDLEEGESTRDIPCPVCGRKGDFALTRLAEGILYSCYRDKCSLGSGFLPFTAAETLNKRSSSNKKTFVPRKFKHSLERLTEPRRSLIRQRWNISKELQIKNGFKYSPEYMRLYMPIRDIRGYDVGAVSREFLLCTSQEIPKAITYWYNDVPKIHFPYMNTKEIGYECKTLVIVEDILSAVRVSNYLPCAALLGTNLAEDAIGLLSGYWDNIVIALDKDTWHKPTPTPIKLANKCKFYFKQTIPFYIEQDFKDMQLHTFNNYIHKLLALL